MSDHTIVHVELAANEPATAGRFYHDLFGWETSPMPMQGGGDYHGFQLEGGLTGGFTPIGEYAQAGDVILYIGTNDIDATLTRATELGATTVLPKMEVPGMGWMGVFRDPNGNKVGLWTDLPRA